MTSSTGFLIRDALESDLDPCLELDHRYSSDYVWQMSIDETTGQQQITFKTQRLPRTLETEYKTNLERLKLALPPEQCFLVVIARSDQAPLGYLTMRHDEAYHTGLIQDIVVSEPFRRRQIGTRLLGAARQWAKEHHINQLTVECTTQNHPGILFCQKAGFAFCGYNDRYFPDHDIAIFFSQALR